MSWLDALILFASGIAAGTINTVVGSGSLLTFPVLVALGYHPILANVTNNMGILPGAISGVFAYRRELAGHLRAIVPLAAASALGGFAGALLLFTLPASAFDAIVPVLIFAACVLVLAGPRLRRWTIARRDTANPRSSRRVVLLTLTGLTGVYGGYFGAAQGVLLLSILSIALKDGLQRANAYKNVLASVASGAAALVFVAVSEVAWPAAGVIAIGAIVGGQIGGTVGRRLPPAVFRVVIVLIGVVAIVYFTMK